MTGFNNVVKKPLHEQRYRMFMGLVRDINQDIFGVSLSLLIILVLLETIKEGFVSFFFNINYLLVVVLASGVITVLAGEEKTGEEPRVQKPAFRDFAIVIGLGVLGTVLVWYQTARVGEIAYLLSIISGVLIVLLSVLLLAASNRRS